MIHLQVEYTSEMKYLYSFIRAYWIGRPFSDGELSRESVESAILEPQSPQATERDRPGRLD